MTSLPWKLRPPACSAPPLSGTRPSLVACGPSPVRGSSSSATASDAGVPPAPPTPSLICPGPAPLHATRAQYYIVKKDMVMPVSQASVEERCEITLSPPPIQNSPFPVLCLQQCVLRGPHPLTLCSRWLAGIKPPCCPAPGGHPISPSPGSSRATSPYVTCTSHALGHPMHPQVSSQHVQLHPGTAPDPFP